MLEYTPPTAAPATSIIQVASGVIDKNRFSSLNSNPIEILPASINYYYSIFSFSILWGEPDLASPPAFPIMLRSTPFTSTTADSLMMFNPSDKTTLISQGGVFSGFFNATALYNSAIENTTIGNAIYLTSIVDFSWNFQRPSYWTIYYAVTANPI